jgi:hypothetical protein
MAPRLRLGAVVVLAVTPSACTLLDGLSGLERSGGDDADGEVVGADVNEEAPDVGLRRKRESPRPSRAPTLRATGRA